MPTKIDYVAIYTPLIKILTDEEIPIEKRVKMATAIMETTLNKKKDDPEE